MYTRTSGGVCVCCDVSGAVVVGGGGGVGGGIAGVLCSFCLIVGLTGSVWLVG